MNPLADPQCSCPSVVERASAALRGEDVAPRCVLHQSGAIEAHTAAQELDVAQRRFAREEAIREELQTPTTGADGWPTCTCNTKQDVLAALVGEPPAACWLHRPDQPAAGNNLALGSDALTEHALGMFGGATLNP